VATTVIEFDRAALVSDLRDVLVRGQEKNTFRTEWPSFAATIPLIETFSDRALFELRNQRDPRTLAALAAKYLTLLQSSGSDAASYRRTLQNAIFDLRDD
jgi:hypothetical protein